MLDDRNGIQSCRSIYFVSLVSTSTERLFSLKESVLHIASSALPLGLSLPRMTGSILVLHQRLPIGSR